jgi:hypothetical protein
VSSTPVPELDTEGPAPGTPSTVEDLPNRGRDRDRCLQRGFEEEGDSAMVLQTRMGTLIAHGYTRLVLGDHGPYVELLHSNIVWDKFKEHVIKAPTRHCHFHYCDGVTLYEQFRDVHDEPNPPEGNWSCANNRKNGYADYVAGRFYISADTVAVGARSVQKHKGGIRWVAATTNRFPYISIKCGRGATDYEEENAADNGNEMQPLHETAQ